MSLRMAIWLVLAKFYSRRDKTRSGSSIVGFVLPLPFFLSLRPKVIFIPLFCCYSMVLAKLDIMFSFLQRYSLSFWPLCLALFILLLVAFNPWLKPWLRYDEGALAEGQVWRLLSAHFVHLGWMHGLLNAAGFVLLALIQPAGRAWLWLCFYAVTSVLISVYIMVDNMTDYYVGASGVLHGLFILAAYFSQSLDLWRRYALIALIVSKLFWEQSQYYQDNGLGDAIGGFVYVDAHLIGGLCGLAVLLVCLIKNRLKFPAYN
jgi:rhomboid family GlyGly-CTERM serine protease